MALEKYVHTADGEEVCEEDINLVALEAAYAEDYVLAELLRLTPYAGTVAKRIMPYETAAGVVATVQPSGLADGKVVVFPFRAIVGTRDTVTNIGADANWKDIRSGIYNVSDSGTAFGHSVSFSANSSGSPRWDLVQAAYTVDANGSSYSRYDKAAAGGSISTLTTQNKIQSVTISVVAGTPAATPTQPAATADGAGIYYFPLAYVRIPNGFGASSTIDKRDVFEVAPVAGKGGSATADGANTVAGVTNTTTNFKWTGAANQRPSIYLPPTMKPEPPLVFELDIGSTSANNSHPITGIIDGSRDWRKRFFKVHIACVATGGAGFAQDRASGASAANRIPGATEGTDAYYWHFGQSFTADAAATCPHAVGAGSSIVSHVTSTSLPPMRGGSLLVIYVDGTDGTLRLDYDTTGPQSKFFFWIEALTPMANY